MNKNLIVGIIIVLILVFGGFLVFRGSRQDEAVPGVSQTGSDVSKTSQVSGGFVRGQLAPEVTFVDFEGNTHNLSDFRGKAVVLDYWAAWCPFCIEEMPELQKAQDKYRDELVMVGVHRTDTEKAETGLVFARDRGVSYLLVKDGDGGLYRAVGGVGMPVAVFIDKDGIVTEIKSGPKTAEEIEEKVSKLLSK